MQVSPTRSNTRSFVRKFTSGREKKRSPKTLRAIKPRWIYLGPSCFSQSAHILSVCTWRVCTRSVCTRSVFSATVYSSLALGRYESSSFHYNIWVWHSWEERDHSPALQAASTWSLRPRRGVGVGVGWWEQPWWRSHPPAQWHLSLSGLGQQLKAERDPGPAIALLTSRCRRLTMEAEWKVRRHGTCALAELFQLHPTVAHPANAVTWWTQGSRAVQRRAGANWKQPFSVVLKTSCWNTRVCMWSSVGHVKHQHSQRKRILFLDHVSFPPNPIKTGAFWLRCAADVSILLILHINVALRLI